MVAIVSDILFNISVYLPRKYINILSSLISSYKEALESKKELLYRLKCISENIHLEERTKDLERHYECSTVFRKADLYSTDQKLVMSNVSSAISFSNDIILFCSGNILYSHKNLYKYMPKIVYKHSTDILMLVQNSLYINFLDSNQDIYYFNYTSKQATKIDHKSPNVTLERTGMCFIESIKSDYKIENGLIKISNTDYYLK